MFTAQRILVPIELDDTEETAALAAQAVSTAATLAEKFSGRVLLLHVARPFDRSRGMDPGGKIKDALDQARDSLAVRRQAQLDALAKTAGPGAEVIDVMFHERVAHAICETAAQAGADCIVLCSHARTGVERLLLGSVAEKVVHEAMVPVVLLKPHKG